MEFNQCGRSNVQYELQTWSAFQQRKTATPLKVEAYVCVCPCVGFDIQGERKKGMDVPHRFPPPAHVT